MSEQSTLENLSAKAAVRTWEVRRGSQTASDETVGSWIWTSTGRNRLSRHWIWPAATVRRVGPWVGGFGSALCCVPTVEKVILKVKRLHPREFSAKGLAPVRSDPSTSIWTIYPGSDGPDRFFLFLHLWPFFYCSRSLNYLLKSYILSLLKVIRKQNIPLPL